ncbi:MAG: adenylate/guanylate cyclase domain-containing protein [Desulfobacter sp.]|nr:MAG: adenylate/guanylate cyclase domain-containing protein [Desulfobacter sp.]
MSDLRGFTSMSETRDPEVMVQLLNRYLGKMSHIILKYDGIIDEIIGDAILAVFGAPNAHKNDPERAIACAIEMQNCLLDLNKETSDQGRLPMEMGIGINTGQVILGNIGSQARMKYGIVGDTVNRASRIESNSIGGQILIGQSTFDLVQEMVTALPPANMMMKGIKKPLIFYSVTAIHSPDFPRHLSVRQPKAAGWKSGFPLPAGPSKTKKIQKFPLRVRPIFWTKKQFMPEPGCPFPLFLM